jgi:hypothetical protein
MNVIQHHLNNISENSSSSTSPLTKEGMFVIALVLLNLMHYNRYADEPYTREDIDDTMESLPRHRIKSLLNVIKALKTKNHIWDRGLFLTITLKKTPEPVLTIELSNFLRINYFNTFIKLFVGLTDCKLQEVGKYRYLVAS